MNLKNTYKLEKYIQFDTASAVNDGSPIPYLTTLPPDLTRISSELNEKIIILISSIVEKYKINKLFRFSDSILGIFHGFSNENIIDCTEEEEENKELNVSKLILIDLSNRTIEYSRAKYNGIAHFKKFLKENDFILIATGNELISPKNISILEVIGILDLKIVAAFSFQEDVGGPTLCPQLRSASAFVEIDPYDRSIYFYLVSKNMPEREFLAQASIMNFKQEILENFKIEHSSDSIKTGIYLPPGTYKGPQAWNAREEFLREEPNFKHWSKFELKSIAKYHYIYQNKQSKNEIQLDSKRYLEIVDEDSNEQTFKFPLKRFFQNDTDDGKSYLQIEFDENLVLPEFVDLFFQTPFGKNIINSITIYSYFYKDELDQIFIYAPSISDQKKIIQLTENYNKVIENIKELKIDMAINPEATHYAFEKINSILNLFNQLDNYSRINQLIREGESTILEFKQTFTMDIKTGTKEERIETSAIKTIAGFLNSKGGKLLIGISDEGQITGLDLEISKFFKSTDKFMLHFKNKIKTRIGEDNYPFLDVNLISIGNSKILEVTCKQSIDPVFVDGNDFYVRTNPATDKLEGPKLINYIKNRFNN